MHRGRLSEQELQGLDEDKLDLIRHYAAFQLRIPAENDQHSQNCDGRGITKGNVQYGASSLEPQKVGKDLGKISAENQLKPCTQVRLSTKRTNKMLFRG